MNATIAQQIGDLTNLNKIQLLALWVQSFGQKPPSSLRRELMIPILAYRIQENEFGGLSIAARKRMKDIANSLGSDKKARNSHEPRLKAGTHLVRSWKGHVHEVSALPNGFEYQGKHFQSLSMVAREITGTRWSGPLFFGTKKERP
jgi:hypothetical protein